MARSGADVFLSALEQYGVTRLFGNPGTTELPLIHALPETEIEYVLGLHEDVAVGMAAGYASTHRHHDTDTPPLGVVNLHVAGGLAHGLGNVFGAHFAEAPLLVTAGNYGTDFQHKEPILHGDLERMARQFTKWSAEIKDVEALPTMVRRAVRVALTPPTGPVFLGLPADVMRADTDLTPERLGAISDSGAGDPEQVADAAAAIAGATEPVFVYGDAIARAGKEAVGDATRLAEASGARVHGEYITTEVSMPTDHEQWVSVLSGDGEEVSATLADADVLLLAGRSTDTTGFRYDTARFPDGATLIHVSHDVWEVGKNEPADIAVVGDPGLVLGAIADEVTHRVNEDELEHRMERVRRAKERLTVEEDDAGDHGAATKAQLARCLDAVSDDALLVNEGVTSGVVAQREMTFDVNGFLGNKSGGLGYGLPAAVGAALAENEAGSGRDVVALIGDGSYLYYPQTLYSATRYDIDLTVVVPNNGNYRILKDNTLRMLGGDESEYDFSEMDFEPPIDLPRNAESYGAKTRRVESPSEILSTLREAVATDGPIVVDIPVRD